MRDTVRRQSGNRPPEEPAMVARRGAAAAVAAPGLTRRRRASQNRYSRPHVLPEWWNWQTRTFEGRVGQPMRVRVPPPAPPSDRDVNAPPSRKHGRSGVALRGAVLPRSYFARRARSATRGIVGWLVLSCRPLCCQRRAPVAIHAGTVRAPAPARQESDARGPSHLARSAAKPVPEARQRTRTAVARAAIDRASCRAPPRHGERGKNRDGPGSEHGADGNRRRRQGEAEGERPMGRGPRARASAPRGSVSSRGRRVGARAGDLP